SDLDCDARLRTWLPPGRTPNFAIRTSAAAVPAIRLRISYKGRKTGSHECRREILDIAEM
ncbi:MAG TPA: hypothetical protein VH855_10110, partial [Acetobacteraceae bacterium]